MTDLRQLEADLAQLREDVDYIHLLLEPTQADPGVSATGGSGLFALPNATEPTTPRGSGAHVWHTLTATEAARAWTTLSGWVDWLFERYHLDDTVAECWYRHDAMIDELDALRAAWTAAYLDPKARPDEPAHWLELLDRTLIRLRAWDRYGCAAGTHHCDSHPATSGTARHDREQHMFADLNARARMRREAAQPSPKTEG